MKKSVIIIFIIVVVLLGIGVVQNVLNTPSHGCTEFYTSTEYRGWHCEGKDIYELQTK